MAALPTAVAHAPIAANVAWHNEICPAKPVITVIDKKMIDEDRGAHGEVDPRGVGVEEE